jgi:hypothetical protein
VTLGNVLPKYGDFRLLFSKYGNFGAIFRRKKSFVPLALDFVFVAVVPNFLNQWSAPTGI